MQSIVFYCLKTTKPTRFRKNGEMEITLLNMEHMLDFM